jgi:hypothetical protein
MRGSAAFSLPLAGRGGEEGEGGSFSAFFCSFPRPSVVAGVEGGGGRSSGGDLFLLDDVGAPRPLVSPCLLPPSQWLRLVLGAA